MVRSGWAVMLLLLGVLPLSAQEAALTTTAQSLTFETPTGAGLRSYSLLSSSLTASHPVRPWISAGTGIHFARASMNARGTSSVDVSGLSSAEIFATVQRGRLGLRATYTPAIGRTGLSSEALVVTSLAGAEVLPFSVRTWGRGNGYGLDATIRVLSGVELFGSLRRHGWFTPLANDPMEYRLGSEARVGTRISTRPTALSLLEIGVLVSRNGSDEDDRQPVFSPGTRYRLHGAVIFPISRATFLLRGDVYRRELGRVFAPVAAIERVPGSVLGGGNNTDARTVTTVSLESRSSAGSVPFVLTVAGRVGEGVSEEWLVWGGIGAEIEIRPPMPGSWHLVPTGRIYRGETALTRNFESAMAGWEFSAALRWSGR